LEFLAGARASTWSVTFILSAPDFVLINATSASLAAM
jgi:hypothetical protein